MRVNFRFRSLPMAAAILTGASFLSPSVFATTSQGAEHAVTAELRELRTQLAGLNSDADRLQMLTSGARLNWQTHATELHQIKTHVNSIGEQLATLQNLRSMGVDWQQKAIDRVMPNAVELAERTTAAINHLNENQNHLWAPEYVTDLRTIGALSDHMHGTVSNYLKIIDAHSEIEQLDQAFQERVS